MIRTRLLACCASVLCSGFLGNATHAQATRPAELDALVAQLGADDFKARDAAQAKIVAMGPAAEAAIEELAAKAEHPEVRQRAQAILKQIAVADTERPTRVTLQFKDAPVEQVYRELFRQAGVDFAAAGRDLFERRRGGADEFPPVTIDLKDVTFWEAIVALEAKTGVKVDGRAGRMRLDRAGKGMDDRRVVSPHGPYLFVAEDLGGGNGIHRIAVFAEPRVRVIAHAMHAKVAGDAVAGLPAGMPAEMRRRRAALVEQRAGEMERHMRPVHDGGHAFDVLVDPVFRRAPGPLKGSVKLRVATAEETIEFDNVSEAKNAQRQAPGGWRATLNAMNPEPGQWFLMAVLSNPQRQPADGAIESAQAVLLDAQGNPLTGGDLSSTSAPTWAAYTFMFRQRGNAGPPAKLRLTLPSETREVEVPFEFGK